MHANRSSTNSTVGSLPVSIAGSNAGSMAKCLHCSRSFAAQNGAKSQFCCVGCATVWSILQSSGLTDFYRLRESSGFCLVDSNSEDRFVKSSFEYCDDPSLIRELSNNGMTMKFYLENLECAACVWLLERLPKICADVHSARVSMADSTIVVYRVHSGSFAKIAETINRLGYRPHLVRSTNEEERLRKDADRKDLIRIAIAGACTGNIMLLSVAIYAGADGGLAELLNWLAAALSLPVLLHCSLPIFKNVVKGFKQKLLSLDFPIAAALVAGYTMSLYSLFSNQGKLYFDSLSMLVFLLLSSRYFLKRIQQTALGRSRLINIILNGTVVRLNGAAREMISAFSLKPGELIEISGELSVPVDGHVVEGQGWIDTSVMTGESAPQIVKLGDRVEAGAKNIGGGSWILQVDAISSDTRLAKILSDTEISIASRNPESVFADQIGKIFTLVVSFGSVALLVWGWHTGQFFEGVYRALALTIVSCPCVFGMAIPLTLSFASRRACSLGALVKSQSCWENLARAETVCFDKTGTLTRGDLSVQMRADIDPKLLQALLSLEQNSRHPIAISIVRYLIDQGIREGLNFDSIEPIPGGGFRAQLGAENFEIVSTDVDSLNGDLLNKTLQIDERDLKGVFSLYRNGREALRFEMVDKLRDEASEVVSDLLRKGYRVQVLSGDRERVVRSCAKKLGLNQLNGENFSFGQTPESKAQWIANHQRCIMVGDGVNDALALAQSSVGIAVKGSMETSLKSAEIYLLKSDLRLIPDIINLAKLSAKTIRQQLFVSATYNTFAATLAICGLMKPLWAAVLMPLSSLSVLCVALLAMRERSK